MTTPARDVRVLRQYELRDIAGSVLVCWLEDDARIQVGRRLTLKGTINRIWTVSIRYDITRTGEDSAFNRGWKVGGLV